MKIFNVFPTRLRNLSCISPRKRGGRACGAGARILMQGDTAPCRSTLSVT